MGKAIVAVVFGGLVVLLFFLMAYFVSGEQPDSFDRKRALQERCETVRVEMTLAQLHEHFGSDGWRSSCLPDDDCREAELGGATVRMPCDNARCIGRWQRETWECRVELTPSGLQAMGPGLLETR